MMEMESVDSSDGLTATASRNNSTVSSPENDMVFPSPQGWTQSEVGVANINAQNAFPLDEGVIMPVTYPASGNGLARVPGHTSSRMPAIVAAYEKQCTKEAGQSKSHDVMQQCEAEGPYSHDECAQRLDQESNLTEHALLRAYEEPCFSCERERKLEQETSAEFCLTVCCCKEPCACAGQRHEPLLRLATTQTGERPHEPTHTGERRHEPTQTGERPHVCDVCGLRFARKSHAVSHARTHMGEKPFACDECGRRFATRRHVKRHALTHTGERPYVCDECGLRFSEKHDMKKHRLIHTGEKPFACDECGQRFGRKDQAKRHVLTHTGEMPYICDKCGRRFADRSRMRRHKLTHSDESVASGPWYQDRSVAKDHLPMDTGEKPFPCDECGRMFSSMRYVRKHKLTHTAEKPFVCDECGHRSSRKCYMKIHKLTHGGERPHVCDRCGQRFAQRDCLTNHMLIHTGQKRNACDECGQRFQNKRDLKEHMLTHADQKPHSCL